MDHEQRRRSQSGLANTIHSPSTSATVDTTAGPHRPKTLLSLPLEIRNKIWTEYLDHYHARYCEEHHAVVTLSHPYKSWCQCQANDHMMGNKYTSISARFTCRQVHRELRVAIKSPPQVRKKKTALITARAAWQAVAEKALPFFHGEDRHTDDGEYADFYRDFVLLFKVVEEQNKHGEEIQAQFTKHELEVEKFASDFEEQCDKLKHANELRHENELKTLGLLMQCLEMDGQGNGDALENV